MFAVPGLPVGADQEPAEQQVDGEADPAPLPRLRQHPVRRPAAHPPPDHPPLAQRGDDLPPARGRVQALRLHGRARGNGVLCQREFRQLF